VPHIGPGLSENDSTVTTIKTGKSDCAIPGELEEGERRHHIIIIIIEFLYRHTILTSEALAAGRISVQ